MQLPQIGSAAKKEGDPNFLLKTLMCVMFNLELLFPLFWTSTWPSIRVQHLWLIAFLCQSCKAWMIPQLQNCYFNHGIHASINETKDMIEDVKQENEDWFRDLFKNWELSGWMLSIIKDIGYFIVVIFLVSLVFGILKRVISNATNRSSSSKVIVAAATTEQEWWEEVPESTKIWDWV